MKKLFLITIIILSAALFSGAQLKTPFPYPTAPDSLETLQQRTSYVVLHFWEKADMKKILKDTTLLNQAFADYISFMPYASADSVKKSIQKLTGKYKKDAKSTMKLVKAAEKGLFSDEAPYWLDEQYLLFVRAALTNKKVSKDDKEYYMNHVRMLNDSQIGSTMSPITYTTRHGAVHNLYDNTGEYTLVYVHNPECSDCNLTSLRMETDVAINALVKDGRLKIIDIYTGAPDEEWRKSAESLPYNWEAGTSDDIKRYLDVRNLPAMYLIDKDRRIIARNLDINKVLSLASALYHQQPK